MLPASPSGEWANYYRDRANARMESGLGPNKSLPSPEQDLEMRKRQICRCQPGTQEAVFVTFGAPFCTRHCFWYASISVNKGGESLSSWG